MRTSPPIMSPMPAPTTGDRSGFAEAKPMEANTRPMSRSKTFGQTVDHVPMGLAGQPCDTFVWLNHVCRLQPTGNGVNGARTVIKMPSEVTAVNFFHDRCVVDSEQNHPGVRGHEQADSAGQHEGRGVLVRHRKQHAPGYAIHQEGPEGREGDERPNCRHRHRPHG